MEINEYFQILRLLPGDTVDLRTTKCYNYINDLTLCIHLLAPEN